MPVCTRVRVNIYYFAIAGSGATAVVQVARCLKNNTKVAIKRIDLERCGSTIEELQVSVPQLSVSSPHILYVVLCPLCMCVHVHVALKPVQEVTPQSNIHVHIATALYYTLYCAHGLSE